MAELLTLLNSHKYILNALQTLMALVEDAETTGKFTPEEIVQFKYAVAGGIAALVFAGKRRLDEEHDDE